MTNHPLEYQLKDIVLESNPGFRYIKSYKLISSDDNKNTYVVHFKEVCMGVSGEDSMEVDIPKHKN